MINKGKPQMYVMENFIYSQRGFFHLVMMFIKVLLLLGLSAGIVHAETPKDIGNWSVSTAVDPIDDSKKVYANLIAKGGRSLLRGISLLARCTNNKTNVFIAWHDYLDGDAKSVLTRLGEAEATSSDWGLSSDNTATFHPQPILFLKALMKESKLVARVTPYRESPLTAEWDLTGAENALKPIREACGW